jgi:hypothetical protein
VLRSIKQGEMSHTLKSGHKEHAEFWNLITALLRIYIP